MISKTIMQTITHIAAYPEDTEFEAALVGLWLGCNRKFSELDEIENELRAIRTKLKKRRRNGL